MRRYRLGDRGRAVLGIRETLGQLGLLRRADTPEPPVFDVATDHAVRHFQQERGLTVNGVVDTATYQALDEARWQLGDRLLSYVPAQPLSGDDVAALQRQVLELGFDVGPVDGVYGPRTEGAVRELQRGVGLPPDGVCGPATFKALQRLTPIVTGGHAEALRQSERVHRAGPRLPGKIVVVDPGHGGADTGCRGHGLTEAAVVFDLASRIEGRLAASGVRILLTRGDGNGPPDVERARFANESGADLFVSLHTDAHPNPDASGVATFYYGSLVHQTSSPLGERFAGLVQRELVARTGLRDCRTHSKTWRLLRATQMTAVWVSAGYLSNAEDAARLADPAYRDLVAEAVVVAIQRVYLPPEMDAPTGLLQMSELLA